MVEIVEVSLVAPAEDTPKHTIWLSNLDLVAPQGHVPMVFFYRRNTGAAAAVAANDDFFSLDVLKAALAKTLVPFYPLAGSVVEGEEAAAGRRRLQIQCTGNGARFTVTRSDSYLSEFEDFGPSSEMTKLLTPKEENAKRPTIGMMVQVTYFKCGGVCVSTAMHRIIADGLTASNVLTTWSKFARGLEATVVKPFINPSLLKARPFPAISFDHREYSPNLSPSAAANVPFDGAVLDLSKEQVDFLKRRCRTKTGAPASTYAAIVAHIWRCVCAARDLQPEQDTRLFIPVDVRSRVRPPLPVEYIGNAVVLTSAVAKVGDVLSRPAAFLLDKYREAIDRVDDEYVRSVIDYLETEVSDMTAVAMGAWQLESTDLWVVSWLNMKGFYEMDFGWGDPVFVSRAQLLTRGFVYIMKNKQEDGGVMVSMGLEKESFPIFKTNFYQVFNNNID